MSSRYWLTLIAIALVVGMLLTLVFWGGPRDARAAGQNLVVLCSSCAYKGLPQTGHLILMDVNTGEIWVYSDAALEGTARPIHWGKLVLGQPVVRPNR